MADSGIRLLRLLALLGGRAWSTAADLAERLDVTPRTVRRDIDSLRGIGYPIESLAGPGGGYGFGRGGRLPPLMLDDGEAVAIAVGLRLLGSASVSGASDLALAASAKLDQLLSPSLRSRVDAIAGSTVSLDRPREDVDMDLLAALADAAHRRRQARIEYEDRAGAHTERLIAPYRLVHARGRWYLVAYDLDKEDWRTFRSDRIATVSVLRRSARIVDPPDPVAYVSRSVSTAPYRYQARAHVEAPPADVRARVPATVGVVEADGSGSLLTTGGDELDLLVGHLVLLGFPFTILEPPELVSRAAEIGASLLGSHVQSERVGSTT